MKLRWLFGAVLAVGLVSLFSPSKASAGSLVGANANVCANVLSSGDCAATGTSPESGSLVTLNANACVSALSGGDCTASQTQPADQGGLTGLNLNLCANLLSSGACTANASGANSGQGDLGQVFGNACVNALSSGDCTASQPGGSGESLLPVNLNVCANLASSGDCIASQTPGPGKGGSNPGDTGSVLGAMTTAALQGITRLPTAGPLPWAFALSLAMAALVFWRSRAYEFT